MTWRDQLRPASWRGVSFFVDQQDQDGGRRLAEHEYPGRDLGYAEDMGGALDGFQVDGYVLEPDHIGQTNRLIEACKAAGAGTLVHPWLGDRTVKCRQYRVSFRRLEGGIAFLQMDFVEAGERRYPEQGASATTLVGRLAQQAKDALGDAFGDIFDVVGSVYDVAADAVADVETGLGEIRDAIEPVVSAVSDASAFLREADAIAGDALSLITNPSQIAGRVLGWMGLPAPRGATAVLSWRTWLPVTSTVIDAATADPIGRQSAPIVTPTQTTQRIADNTAAIETLICAGAVAEAARAAVCPTTLVTATTSAPTYAIAGEAIAARTALAAAFDAIEPRLPAAAIDPYIRLRAETLSALTALAPALPDVQTITLPATVPALVLANTYYGGTTSAILGRADEIIARNGIPHPLFVPAGQAIEVLTDG